jgi:hypothetical protein
MHGRFRQFGARFHHYNRRDGYGKHQLYAFE